MRLLSSILLLFVVPLVTAQNLNNHEKLLVGDWVFDKINFADYIQERTENDLAMLEVYRPVLEESFQSIEFTFTANKKMVTRSQGMSNEGVEDVNWQIIDNGTVLSTSTEMATEYMAIGKLSANELVLIIDTGDMQFGLCLKKK
jgi:hypothetical protein